MRIITALRDVWDGTRRFIPLAALLGVAVLTLYVIDRGSPPTQAYETCLFRSRPVFGESAFALLEQMPPTMNSRDLKRVSR